MLLLVIGSPGAVSREFASLRLCLLLYWRVLWLVGLLGSCVFGLGPQGFVPLSILGYPFMTKKKEESELLGLFLNELGLCYGV